MSLRHPLAVVLLCGALLAGSAAYGASRPVTKKKAPVYPELAKRMHVAGTVKLEVTIDASGKVESVKALSGHQLLTSAAIEAVKDWVYEPGDATTSELIEIEFK
jgi:TonB family protein